MYHACMVALQIRDVPPEVRDVLAEQARARGQSLQAYLLWLVTQEATRSANVSLLHRFVGRTDGSQVTATQAVDELDRMRSSRDPRGR